GHDVDQVLREAPDRRRVAEQLVRVQVDAAGIAVAVVEVPVDHQDLGLPQILQRFLAQFRSFIHSSSGNLERRARRVRRETFFSFSAVSVISAFHVPGCYKRMPIPSFTYTARPPTMVAATPPRSVQPSNGVFLDSERIDAAA